MDWKNPMQTAEHHLKLVPSVEHRGYRVRVLRRQLFFRPPTETFHEFLTLILQHTLGETWWKQHKAFAPDKKHVVMKWFEAMREFYAAKRTDDYKVKEGIWAAAVTGYAQSLLQLSFDVFSLQQVGQLPESMIARLRDKKEFQGVRYEIAVASMFARAGFTIAFCEPAHGQKICEFIARHPSGTSVAVEAKSRRRPGVLNEKGQPSEDSRADLKRLYTKARKKKPGQPFIIFLDFNLPATPDIPWSESPWLEDIKEMLNDFPEPTPQSPDAHNAVVITNHSYYYQGNELSKMQPVLYLLSQHPRYPFSNNAWNDLFNSIERYSNVPDEV